VLVADPCALHAIIERIKTMFDLNADWMVIAGHLRGDAVMAPLMQTCPGLRVPGCWDPFELAVRAMVGQQVSVAAATSIMGKLVQHFWAHSGEHEWSDAFVSFGRRTGQGTRPSDANAEEASCSDSRFGASYMRGRGPIRQSDQHRAVFAAITSHSGDREHS
jgi:hypothetical protein